MRQIEPHLTKAWLLGLVAGRNRRMNRMLITFAVCCLLSGGITGAQPSGTGDAGRPVDSSPHTVRFVSVENGVKLEVLDWGGTGRPLVLLAGMGFDAHVYDAFAAQLVQFRSQFRRIDDGISLRGAVVVKGVGVGGIKIDEARNLFWKPGPDRAEFLACQGMSHQNRPVDFEIVHHRKDIVSEPVG